MSGCMDTSSKNINVWSHGNTLKILLFLLNETDTDTHSQDSCGKGILKKHWWNLVGKSAKLGMLIRAQKTKVILIGLCGWHQNCRKKQNLGPMWKKLMKNIDIEEPTTFLDHVYLGCTQRECKPNEKIIGQQQDVSVPYFCWSNRKISRTGQTALKNFSAVLWHGRTCSKMRGTVLRIGKQEDRASTQGFQSLFGRSPN